jgi:hypothetical protein
MAEGSTETEYMARTVSTLSCDARKRKTVPVVELSAGGGMHVSWKG